MFISSRYVMVIVNSKIVCKGYLLIDHVVILLLDIALAKCQRAGIQKNY